MYNTAGDILLCPSKSLNFASNNCEKDELCFTRLNLPNHKAIPVLISPRNVRLCRYFISSLFLICRFIPSRLSEAFTRKQLFSPSSSLALTPERYVGMLIYYRAVTWEDIVESFELAQTDVSTMSCTQRIVV